MIIIIPVNGLLNRIRSILSAKLIANALGEKLSVLWIPEPCCNCHYEHIFGNNHILWEAVCSNEISTFTKRYGLNSMHIPLYFVEKDNVCTLRGYNKGEQYFMEQFMTSKCELKIIKAGGEFYIPTISKDTYNKQKMELYSRIVFANAITEKVSAVPPKTLGLHLRFTDRKKYAPSPNQIYDAVQKLVNKNSIKNIKIVSDDLQERENTMKALQKNHPDINVSVSNIMITSRTSYLALQYAMVDWLTLCHCDSLIFFTGSSFGYEAFVWNLNRDVEEIPNRNLLMRSNLRIN